MAPRAELRGALKQSQRTSEIADARLPSNLNSTGRGTKKESQTGGKDNNIRVRTKRSSHNRKECVNESLEHNDELVKYMSKLPGYLQRTEERGEQSVQSNVLNVGVLDWGRLEKWKHGRERGGERSGKSERRVSSIATTSTSGLVPNDSHRCKIDDQLHTCSKLGKGKASRDLQHSVHGVRCTLEPEFASRDLLNKQQIATCSYTSCGRDRERVNPGKSRSPPLYRESTSGLLSEMGNSGGSLAPKGNSVLRDKEAEKRAGKIHAQEARERATERAKQCVEKLNVEEKIIGVSKAGLTSEKQENQQVSNIVLLRSRKQSRSTLPGEPEMPLDDNMKVAREVNRSLDFSDRANSSLRLRSQIPRSCPLSFDLERDSEDMMLPLGVDISGEKERFGGTRRQSKTGSRIFDLEIPEDELRNNRHPSPSKRFSFSFGRLSRSFTFKEDSSAQPLNSFDDTIKSDSMRFDGSVCPSHSSNPERQNIYSRVSPLKRLLDPLLKPKGSENILPSKARSSCSNPKPTNIEVPLQDEKKQDTSRTRALFQLTIRNGIPLFQFVVDDNNNNNNKKSSRRSILGATMKSSPSSFKDDSVQCCTFYSVNEVKKKRSGSWLIHGHKEKQRGFVYNVIGQMRLSNSVSSDLTEQKSGNISPAIRESVLFDESEQVKGREEVAAIVIKKKPVEENYTGLEEISVIIPSGVHSFPEKGAPSPLISRWRTGGLCDCGGWDVGCKLHVLSNKTLLHEFNQSFKLFDEEGSERDSGPALAMTELKSDIYRVEFGSCLSHLQAFFVCVTVITCGSQEDSVSKTTVKSPSPFAPPLSPVGRV
ncbi:hypothetical protein EUTSA_v10012705mg [Eutrema salsugineum]|uniref:Uncharacterized protein n=1 Tax=Eutrema salsugineum TaxID=72664 RepID=V4L903_EUTSA|nr:uncharacterized protein LOC18019405 [Eutrema salsugineum]XP_006398662.1 uncharacterized protein LOC18019405 [Eutrema salsugineum]ESQ40114.1 hypothetical protein EUTSA_v10012705mg [Eutrema salsugineum]ESQ40115.1 hypothetical protein EUTSA_v10012705mg [Eutrema salsugineum]